MAGRFRIDARQALRILAYVARNPGVGLGELVDLTGTSKATVKRMLRTMRAELGVEIAWRPDRDLPSGGEYSIEDWGVFDSRRVLADTPDRTAPKTHRNAKASAGALDACIRSVYPTGGPEAVLAHLPQYSRSRIVHRAGEIGIRFEGRRARKPYSREEEKIIQEEYPHQGAARLSIRLGRPQDSIRAKAQALGAKRNQGRGSTASYKLDETRAREIKARLNYGESARRIADDFGLSLSTIYNIKNGRTWAHVVPAKQPEEE
ncbi:MAG: helix-turn-helix domain-containing protein [Thiohalorhabdus sp.]|uniref:helix-turn-helix domain-containing protein n=1 Tax=Thiohalorhabdus sp. TaxID=3094134 RepID=UPI003980C852